MNKNYEYINTPVKCAKSRVLDNKCNPSCGPSKHQTEPFPPKQPKRGYQACPGFIKMLSIPSHQICKMLKKGQWQMPGFLLSDYILQVV